MCFAGALTANTLCKSLFVPESGESRVIYKAQHSEPYKLHMPYKLSTAQCTLPTSHLASYLLHPTSTSCLIYTAHTAYKLHSAYEPSTQHTLHTLPTSCAKELGIQPHNTL